MEVLHESVINPCICLAGTSSLDASSTAAALRDGGYDETLSSPLALAVRLSSL